MMYRFSAEMVSQDSISAQTLERFTELLQCEIDRRGLGVDVELVSDSDVPTPFCPDADEHIEAGELTEDAWWAAMDKL